MSSEERTSIIRKFERECIQHANFRHPNIVQVIGIHSVSRLNVPMLILEYMAMSLNNCLKNSDIPLSLKYRILLDVSLGLRFLHEQDPPFIHRDLTANNVLLSENMQAKIADFGVGRVLDAITMKGATMTRAPGTQAYMPPEATVAKPKYTTKLDIFSFGILIIHVLLQEWPLPIRNETMHDPNDPNKLVAVSQVEMRAEYFDRMGIENKLTPIAKKCLSNNAELRPNIDEIHELLQMLVTQVPYPFSNSLEAYKTINSNKATIQALKRNDLHCLAEIQALLMSESSMDKDSLIEKLSSIAFRFRPMLEQSLPSSNSLFIVTHPSNSPMDLKLSNASSSAPQFTAIVRPPLSISFGATFVQTVPTGVISPRGIAVSNDGVVYVVNYDGQKGVHVYYPNGSTKTIIDAASRIERSTPPSKCWYPHGVAVDRQGNVFLSDTGSHRVLKFNADGILLATAGTADQPGSDNKHFNKPRGLVYSKNDQVFVCDTMNHRIQVFDSNLKFVYTFGKEGNGPLEFYQPFDIDFDVTGKIYVVDGGNHCIKIFSPDFKLFGQIGGKSQNRVEDFRSPMAICIDIHNNIFVADHDKHCVLVFDSRGQFMLHFGSYGDKEGSFNHPIGLATDQCGQLYVSDKYNQRVLAYK